jgi:peroxiredoxin
MAATPSTMLSLGTPLPDVTLTNVLDGQVVRSLDFAAGARGTLVMFICNHCPYVIHVRKELIKLAHEAMDQGFKVLAINSNSSQTHPQDGPEHMATLAKGEGWKFPFLFDETQDVAKTFKAACTPDFYLFDGQGKLAYRGQFDNSRPGNGMPVSGSDLRGAIETVAAGSTPSDNQRASIGCNIKWHPGNAPEYFG